MTLSRAREAQGPPASGAKALSAARAALSAPPCRRGGSTEHTAPVYVR